MFFLIKLLDVLCFIFQQFDFQAFFLLQTSLTTEKCFSRGVAVICQCFLLGFGRENFNSPGVFNQREDGQICRQFSAQKIHPVERPDVLKFKGITIKVVSNFTTLSGRCQEPLSVNDPIAYGFLKAKISFLDGFDLAHFITLSRQFFLLPL